MSNRIQQGSKQFVYDVRRGSEYLDCISYEAVVGHAHPQLASAIQCQAKKMSTAQGFRSKGWKLLVRKLSETLPAKLRVCYFCNSGKEAQSIAIRYAFQYIL